MQCDLEGSNERKTEKKRHIRDIVAKNLHIPSLNLHAMYVHADFVMCLSRV